jgi:peptidoglycan/xylan/chitin deacetylase (PgdA/CDA1 family)
MSPIVANFHGIGTPPAGIDAGERPYWLSPDQYVRALDALAASGRPFMVTFDDGNLSDLTIGVPACVERNIATIVFACSGRIGAPGYLASADLRELAALPDCKIGSHGAVHRPWTGLAGSALAAEVAESKARIEDALGRAITAAGLPFGRYDRHVLSAAARAGYAEVYSSDGSPRLSRRGVQPRLSLRGDAEPEGQVRRLLALSNPAMAVVRECWVRFKERRG